MFLLSTIGPCFQWKEVARALEECDGKRTMYDWAPPSFRKWRFRNRKLDHDNNINPGHPGQTFDGGEQVQNFRAIWF